jgi:hypothetical protein
MVNLLHEVWIDTDDMGQQLPCCCLAGPDGDANRRALAQNARLVYTFWAGSHHEAMVLYHRFLGRGPYTTDFKQDYEPYPAEWLSRQRDRAT